MNVKSAETTPRPVRSVVSMGIVTGTPPALVLEVSSGAVTSGHVGVAVAVAVGVVVGVNVAVADAVGVLVGVNVGVLVGVNVAVGVDVGVFVGVNVGVSVGVNVDVGVGVGITTSTSSAPMSYAGPCGRASPSMSTVTFTLVSAALSNGPPVMCRSLVLEMNSGSAAIEFAS